MLPACLASSLVLVTATASAQTPPPVPTPLPPGAQVYVPAQPQPTYYAPQPVAPQPVAPPAVAPQPALPQQAIPQQAAPQPSPYSNITKITDWDSSEPIPAGFHTATRVRTGLIVGGSLTFGLMYLTSAFIGAGMMDSHNDGGALLVPIAGPFVQIGKSNSAVAGVSLALDGLVQAAGAAMIIGAIAAPRMILVRDYAGIRFMPTPVATSNGAGLGVVGTF